jgi:hypothetical protein
MTLKLDWKNRKHRFLASVVALLVVAAVSGFICFRYYHRDDARQACIERCKHEGPCPNACNPVDTREPVSGFQ